MRLSPVKNNADYFGDQVVVDENDEIVRFEEKLLINSVQISLDEAVTKIKSYGGLIIPSHVDSPTYSIISQLGYVPENLTFDALEIKDRENIPQVLPFVLDKALPFVTFSDSHYIKDIGRRRTLLDLEKASFEEVAHAFRRMHGK